MSVPEASSHRFAGTLGGVVAGGRRQCVGCAGRPHFTGWEPDCTEGFRVAVMVRQMRAALKAHRIADACASGRLWRRCSEPDVVLVNGGEQPDPRPPTTATRWAHHRSVVRRPDVYDAVGKPSLEVAQSIRRAPITSATGSSKPGWKFTIGSPVTALVRRRVEYRPEHQCPTAAHFSADRRVR